MGTVHKFKIKEPVIDSVEDLEFKDGDDGGDEEGFCPDCRWWYSYEGLINEKGEPSKGSCRYTSPPWTDTDRDDWCRHFEYTQRD